MELGIIAAVAENGVIGNKGNMPWHFSEDLKRFKKLTTGHPVVMGRKTYESIGSALSNRLNIVLSRNPEFKGAGVIRHPSLEEALENMRGDIFVDGIDFSKAYVIGGSEIYREAMPLVSFMDITKVWSSPEGDTFFPKFNERHWKDVHYENHSEFSFVSYRGRIV